jgi:hypothetical protein
MKSQKRTRLYHWAPIFLVVAGLGALLWFVSSAHRTIPKAIELSHKELAD